MQKALSARRSPSPSSASRVGTPLTELRPVFASDGSGSGSGSGLGSRPVSSRLAARIGAATPRSASALGVDAHRPVRIVLHAPAAREAEAAAAAVEPAAAAAADAAAIASSSPLIACHAPPPSPALASSSSSPALPCEHSVPAQLVVDQLQPPPPPLPQPQQQQEQRQQQQVPPVRDQPASSPRRGAPLDKLGPAGFRITGANAAGSVEATRVELIAPSARGFRGANASMLSAPGTAPRWSGAEPRLLYTHTKFEETNDRVILRPLVGAAAGNLSNQGAVCHSSSRIFGMGRFFYCASNCVDFTTAASTQQRSVRARP
jgi:hypothetical protein